jgi:ATP-dependent Zn protease
MADRVSVMLAEAYRDAKRLIRRYRRRVVSIADLLLDRETVDGEELEGMFRKRKRRRPKKSPPRGGA